MKKLLLTLVAAAAMWFPSLAATGDVTTVLDQTFEKDTKLSDTDTYTWGSEIEGMIATAAGDSKKPYNKYGIFVTNNNDAANNYDAKDFVTFANPLGNDTEEVNIAYLVECPQDQNNNNGYFEVNFYNDKNEFVFGIKEGNLKGWTFSSDLMYAVEGEEKSTIAFPSPHMEKAGGSTVNITLTFNGTETIIDVDGVKATAYSATQGIKSIKFAVTGEKDWSRPMVIRNLNVSTKEVEAAQYANYTINYVCNGETIKSQTINGVVGQPIIISDLEKQTFYNENKTAKYFYSSDDSANKTITADGQTIVTINFRAAETYSYKVKSNVDDIVIATGSVLEGESETVPYRRYIIDKNNVVWMKAVGDTESYTITVTPDKDGYETTVVYSETEMTDGIFFTEAEAILTSAATAGNRGSNYLGGYGSAVLYTLNPGSYNFKFAALSSAKTPSELTLMAGDSKILSGTPGTKFLEFSTASAFSITTPTDITIQGTNSSNVLDYILITGEEAKATDKPYNIQYKLGDDLIKEVEGGMGSIGSSITLTDAQLQPFFENDIKYFCVSNDASTQTIVADGSTVVTVTVRKAETYNYTVKANVDDVVIKSGTVFEGEKVTEYFSKYIIAKDGTVWSREVANNKSHDISFTPDNLNYVYTLEYTATDKKDGIFFKEAEDKYYTDNNVLIASETAGNRGSNKLGGYTTETSAKLYTLKPGTYNIEIGAIGPAGDGAILHVKAGENEVITTTALYSTLGKYSTSSPFTVSTETDITIEGTNNKNFLDYILITGVEMVPEDPWEVSYPHTWDFRGWDAETTVKDLKADSNWTDIEKADATEPTDATKDNCFWQVSKSDDLSMNKYIQANGTTIEELKGLVYTNETNDRSLAIAVNYPKTDLGEYNGGSYLWLGGKEINYFKIPSVPAGATIKIGVESHKCGVTGETDQSKIDARGVQLSINGTVLTAPDESAVVVPTTYEEQEWFVPMTAAATNDVQITNTNGCHIYFITVTPGAEVEGIAINDSEGNPVENLELKIGAAAQLSAVITPDNAVNKKVTWKSSNEDIATVDQTGNVTSVAKGDVEITATSSNGKTATCKVTVVDVTIVVENIELDKTEASINVGEKLQLEATVTPAEASVSWASDNEEIATVDANGNVTAVDEGEAIITATAGDKTATCTITVTVPVDGITLNFEKITVETGDEFTVGYTISPDNATDKTVTWTSSSEEVATVDENGNVKVLAAGEAVITAKAGSKEASCTITVVAPEETDGARVRMTYVDMNNPTTPIGIIQKGESSRSGFNAISNGSVGFGNTGWGENKITYIQVDASAIKDNYITSATLTFEASGSTDSKRQTKWGVGYNSSTWSSAMTYDSADKSITTLGDTQTTSTKASSTFETFSFDITEAINEADGRIATILVYETEAAGGYIKNPVVKIESTNELVYKVTFTETGGAEEVKVTVNDQDATNGISLPNGTYSYTATASHCKDYEGEFTVSDEDLNVEFAITPREVWSYTVNAVDANGEFLKELSKGEGYEEENVTYYFPGYYLQGSSLLSKNRYSSNPYYGENAQLDSNGKIFVVKYDGTPISDVVFYKEAEDMDEFTSRDTNNAPIRCSNGLGGTVDGEVLLTTLPAGQYKIHGQVWGTTGLKAGVKIKAASEEEEDTYLWTLESTGSIASKDSEEFILAKETELYVYTSEGTDKRMLDYIYITGTEGIPATGITLDATSKELNLEESVKLTATVTPQHTTDVITWASSNEDIATVDNAGNVTAVKAGRATITATAGEFSAECVITCKSTVRGDATGDGKLEINDVIDISNFILEDKKVPVGWTKEEWTEFYIKAADLNGDHKVTISDALAAVTLVLNQESSAASQARVAANYEFADNLVICGKNFASNGKTSVAVTLDNSMDYVAVQADIFMPEGVNFDVKPGSRIANSHSFQTKRFDDNHIRVVIYTFNGNAFADNNEALFEIVADSYISDPTDITLAHVLASDADAKAYVLGARYDSTNGVAALGFDGNAPVKVYDLNGRYISDKVDNLEQGIYIFRQGNNAKKVRIR